MSDGDERSLPRAPRWLIAACAAGLSLFVLLVGAAMWLYPGGTWFDARAVGHTFWENFLCDLFHRRALNGVDNSRSALLATVGTLLMFAALAAFFTLVSLFDPRPRRSAKVTKVAGWLACAAGVAVPLTPSDRSRVGHLSAVLIACAPAIVATGAAVWLSVRAPVRRSITVLSLMTLGFGTIDAILYAIAFGVDARLDRLYLTLPVFQRLATLSLLGWVLATLDEHVRRIRAAR